MADGPYKERISLNEGSGGDEMQKLISSFRNLLGDTGKWHESDDDSAVLELSEEKSLCFTTDSFVVSPVFFPGGNIGDLAFAGTVNDLIVMGANPLGLSMGLVVEEGFLKSDLDKIMVTIGKLSKKYNIPIVTGDTKVMEKGKIDGIVINTSGIGIIEKGNLLKKEINVGDKVIISGGVGEHAVALLSKRFDYETDLITDSKPLVDEMNAIRSMVKQAKDPTRGGLSACLNEICSKNSFGVVLDEHLIPVSKEVKTVTEMLGLNTYELASEGRVVCICSPDDAVIVVEKLRKFNKDASIIGEIVDDKEKKVIIKTEFGERVLHNPIGRIVPRIC